MSEFDPTDLWYIKLADYDSKYPRTKWGGYSQSFVASEDVYTHDEVVESDWEHWAVVGTRKQVEHTTLTTLIFDLDIHKADDPESAAERMTVPDNSLLVKSQSGGFHVYFYVHAERGELNESDFKMAQDLDWDVDIRGSSVSMHVVAPSDIEGVRTPYEVVNDSDITTVIDPADAAERITFDGEPLLEFDRGRRYGNGVDIDRDVEPPEEMPTCYHRGLQLRHSNPDDHPNTHKVNVLTALCGLSAGYDVETMVGHFCDEYPPGKGVDRGVTQYHLEHIAKHVDRGRYSPPALSTLRDFGILAEDETCECSIPYHGSDDVPSLDVVQQAAEEVAAEIAGDGGTAADTAHDAGMELFDQVQAAIAAFADDEIQAKTARHRIATAFVQEHSFVYPEVEVRGWRSTLYVFNHDEGVYEPRGERFVEAELERIAGDFVTNQTRNEIVEKIKRMSSERGEAFMTSPEKLVVGNGILDLHTGKLEPYTPDEYHRTKIGVDWNPDAGTPDAIDEFLHDIVRPEDVPTLHRLIAHTLYKEYATEKAAMLVGSGQNGKSVFLELVEKFLGGENVTHRALQEFDENEFAAHQLAGKLANVHPDMGDAAVTDMSAFKKLTGRDTMLANVKYEQPIKFENYATLMFAANEMPVFGEDNHAIWRRWLYIDFPHTFNEHDSEAKDPEPKRVLMRRLTDEAELEALLYRCQQEIQEWFGGREWFASAMRPDEVREQMKKAAEPIYNFASVCLQDADDEWLPKERVRECYRLYAEEEGLPKLPESQFGERLMGLRDYQIDDSRRRENGSRVQTYDGIQFSSRGRQVLGLDHDSDEAQAGADDQWDQAKPKVLEELAAMVELNDREAVDRDALMWRCTGSGIGKAKADQTIDILLEEGEIYDTGDGLLPV